MSATALVVWASVCAPAFAADGDFSLEASAGVRYDSNISVEEADILVGAEDVAAVFDVATSYELETSAGSLELGYAFGQRLYDDFDQFDLQSHSFSAGAQTRLAGARLGLDYSYNILRLGGDPFLDLQLISPSIAGFVAPKTYVRGYYQYMKKDFETLSNRDADRHSAGASLFRFFMNNDAYVSVGGRYETEDANAPEFDFDGFLLDANLKLPLPGIQDGEVQFGYDYRERDYNSLNPSIGERRQENRSRFEAEAEIPIVGGLALHTGYQYTDRNSNFPSSDYNEHLVTGALSYRFF